MTIILQNRVLGRKYFFDEKSLTSIKISMTSFAKRGRAFSFMPPYGDAPANFNIHVLILGAFLIRQWIALKQIGISYHENSSILEVFQAYDCSAES